MSMRVSCWLFASACVISFILGRHSRDIIGGEVILGFYNSHSARTNSWSEDSDHDLMTLTQQRHESAISNHMGETNKGVANKNEDLLWELNMRRARPYNGISIPQHNGYSAKCIPDEAMKQMNSDYSKGKLNRMKMGLMDGQYHDNVISSAMQVGDFVHDNMKYDVDGRPIWTREIWDHYQNELNQGNMNVGPPRYTNSGTSVTKAVQWALHNTLASCGKSTVTAENIIADDDSNQSSSVCQISVFSAISPWAEAMLYWSASNQNPPRTVRITSVDFNPCILENVPPDAIAECRSPLSFVTKSDNTQLFDLTVSYSGIEHDGLGRYGDPINPNGDVSAMREMWLLTKPGGVLLLAVPRAGKNSQPRTNIPIWGNKKIQILQHRAYGAERYMMILVGWAVEGFVIAGRDVIESTSTENKMMAIARMLECSFVREHSEHQPLLILRKLDDMTFGDVLSEGNSWSDHKAQLYEEEYRMAVNNGSVTCYGDGSAQRFKKGTQRGETISGKWYN